MEQEIDLRPYVQSLTRRWYVIVGLVVALVGAAAAYTLTRPSAAQARSDVFVVSRETVVSLDERVAERDASMLTTTLNQRQALTDLASSLMLEARVVEALGLGPVAPGSLAGRINVTATSDLVRVVATAPTEAEALRLAEAWANEYSLLVNELYSESISLDDIDAELAQAQGRFDEVQVALGGFYAEGALVRAEQQILRLKGLLEGGAEAQVSLYTSYLTRTQELNLILEDARALQAQYEGEGSADLSAGLSALAVRARLAGADELPVQLSFGSAESFAQGQVAAADLDRFVTVLEAERERMVARAEALGGDLAAGNSAVVGLPPEARARYEEELAAARGDRARAEGEEKMLIARRDVALSSLQVLQARRAEASISQSVPQVRVRVVGASALPPESRLNALVVNGAAAAALGLALGGALALALGMIELRRRSPVVAAPPAPEPVGRSSASD